MSSEAPQRSPAGAVSVSFTPVREIMEQPVTAHPDDDVEKVLRLLREHELPGVPIVDDEGRLAGIVTESDLILADEQGELHLPHYIELFGSVIPLEPLRQFEQRLRKAYATKVADLMTADPVTVQAADSVEHAAHLIATKRHNRLPVLDGDRLVGMVTRLDVMEALHGQPSHPPAPSAAGPEAAGSPSAPGAAGGPEAASGARGPSR